MHRIDTARMCQARVYCYITV